MNNQITTDQLQAPVKKRRRAIPLERQLQAALLDAAAASKPGVADGLRCLIQRRCEILNGLLRATEHGKLLQARERVKTLEADNARLREELAVAQGGSVEAARIRRIIEQHAPNGGNNANV